jgi:hypothetical protein
MERENLREDNAERNNCENGREVVERNKRREKV